MEEKKRAPPVNDEVLGGIKAAIERKEDLKSAMMSFYRAGYSKIEIEGAARRYLETKKQETYVEKEVQKKIAPKKPLIVLKGGQKTEQPILQKKPIVQNITKVQPKLIPKVSDYGAPKKKRHFSTMTIALILILVFLVGILVTVFLFKAELVDFINNLFG